MTILDKLNARIEKYNSDLAQASYIQEQKELFYNEMIAYQEDYNKLKEAYDNICKLLDVCQTFAVKYRDLRIDELERRCENILDLVFPDESFGVKIKTGMYRKKEVASLIVGPKNKPQSQWFPPVSENGGLVKQLIGASIIASICEMVGADFIFFDEMFCSGDAVSVSEIEPFFNSIMAKDIQLFIIEHKPSLYDNIKRREIHLGKDRVGSGAVRILKVVDEEPEDL